MNSFQYGFFDELEKIAAGRRASRALRLEEQDAENEYRDLYEHVLKNPPGSRKKSMLIGGLIGGAALGLPLHAYYSEKPVHAVAGLNAATVLGAYLGKKFHDKRTDFYEEAKRELGKLKKTAAKGVATKTNPGLWARAKAQAKAKMGGKHSARAMQLATQIYKKGGGGYSGSKPSASSNKMAKWTKQKWRTRPGTNPIAKKESGRTSRYLPEKKWNSLSKGEQIATDKKKLSSSNQFVSNTPAARVKSKHKYT